MNVMLLSAGEGTRLRPFTLERPKPRIPFLTVPLAFYSLSLFDEIEIENLAVNTYHLPDQIRQIFKLIPPEWKSLHFFNETNGLLDSGGGIHNAQKILNQGSEHSFFVANADEIILPHKIGIIKEMIRFHEWHQGLATLMTIDHPEVGHKFGGAWTLPNSTKVQCFSKTSPKFDHINDLSSSPSQKPQGHHYVGVLLLNKRIFSYFKEGEFKETIVKENILYDTLTKAIQNKESVHCFKTEAHWFETGNPEDFMSATSFCLSHLEQKSKIHWLEYLKQTIRIYSQNELFLEKNWEKLDQLKRVITSIKKGDL